MTRIAEQIVDFYRKDTASLMLEAENLADDIEQDWDSSTTEYIFPDGSYIVVSCGSVLCRVVK